MNKVERKLHRIDATEQSIGRLASRIVLLLRGKNKPEFTPNIDAGDIVEVSNINQAKYTGNKLEQKKYYRYSGYPGGLKTLSMKKIAEKNPADILKRAVKGMLPPNKFKAIFLKRLVIKQ